MEIPELDVRSETDFEEWSHSYVMQLWSRRAPAEKLQSLQLFPAHRAPKVNTCHEVVTRLVSISPDLSAARGWLLVDLGGLNNPRARFHAHSAVQNRSGALIAVEPIIGLDIATFIRANISESAFHEVVLYLTRTTGSAVLEYAP
jgi:hypothetical protein